MSFVKPNEVAQRDVAGVHMVTAIPRARGDMPVDSVIASMKGHHYECADTVDAVGRLEGIIRINDLFADTRRPLRDLMEPKYSAVRYNDDQEKTALIAMRLEMIAVPVVDNDNKLIGAVPPEALLRTLRFEHMEDIQRLAGIRPQDNNLDLSLDAPMADRVQRRLPWLLFALLASTVMTLVMAKFEKSLSANVAVAFFVPALVYVAGAIGTQALSVAVRGLSDNDFAIAKLLCQELVIGSVIGATLGALSFTASLIAFGQTLLAAAVGLSVFAGGLVSALVGFGLPWVFKRLGSDPALGSGPICTIIQDASTIAIYFLVVTLFMV